MPLRDLACAGRMLRKNPVFTLTAVATIALGIGAGAGGQPLSAAPGG